MAPLCRFRHTSAWSTEADFIATAHGDLALNKWASSPTCLVVTCSHHDSAGEAQWPLLYRWRNWSTKKWIVHVGCHNTDHRLGGLAEIYFSHFWKLGRPRSKPKGFSLLSLVCWQLLSLCALARWASTQALVSFSSYKNTNPIRLRPHPFLQNLFLIGG